MKSQNIFILMAIASVLPCHAYEEWSIPNLIAPTSMDPVALEATYQHQFIGQIIERNSPVNMFGAGDGADVNIGFRSVVWRKAQVHVSYDSKQLFQQSHNEFTAGLGYTFFVEPLHLRLQAGGEVFTYASYLAYPEVQKTGFFLQGGIQNDPFFNRLIFIGDIGYRFNGKAPGLGLGFDVVITDFLDVYASYFPVWEKNDKSIEQSDIQNPYLFGVKITTSGHQFFIYASNMMETGMRHMMQGTIDNNLRLGFVIKRLFTF